MEKVEFEIKPKNNFSLGLKELWEYRELFYFFAWRDIKVKYKQTALGVLWAVFQPLLMTALFTLSFGKVIAGQTQLNSPYPVFALSGFLLWNVFSSGLSNAGNSMVNNSNIIKKIYFPRLVIPISSILVSLIDFVMAFLIFIPVLYYYGCGFTAKSILFIPASVVLAMLASFGFGLLLSAVNVKYRDFRYVLPFFIQAMLFITPVIYPISISTNGIFKFILKLNPMNAPIELFRCSITNGAIDVQGILVSSGTSLILLIIGIVYFRRTEMYFADLA